MPTRKQKEELLNALKFTPRTVEISLSGYGGEIVMGLVDNDTYNYWTDQGDDALTEFVSWWDDEVSAPDQYQFVSPGSWYECDNHAHACGIEMSDHCRLTVYDPAHNSVDDRYMFECDLNPDNLTTLGIQLHQSPEIVVDSLPSGTAVFLGQSIEKGTFFSAEVRLTQPFDPKKLSITYCNYNGWMLLDSVMYCGEELEGSDGYSTTGKSSNFELLTSDGSFEESNDSAETAQSWPQVNESDMTNWFTFKKHKPVHSGQYQVIVEGTLHPVQFATWKNQQWQHDENTQSKLPVSAWRGLNYSTVDQ